MVPIFEQGNAIGIGYSYDSFIKRFTKICKEHLDKKRAKAFAFIFYNFRDEAIRSVLKEQGGFAQLDRLSGNDLSIFYLHSGSKKLIQSFNEIFMFSFDVDVSVSLPMVMFIKFDANVDEITDFQVLVLEQTNYQFAFQELYETIRIYIEQLNQNSKKNISTKHNKLIGILHKAQRISIEQFVGMFIQEAYKNFMG